MRTTKPPTNNTYFIVKTFMRWVRRGGVQYKCINLQWCEKCEHQVQTNINTMVQINVYNTIVYIKCYY